MRRLPICLKFSNMTIRYKYAKVKEKKKKNRTNREKERREKWAREEKERRAKGGGLLKNIRDAVRLKIRKKST